MLLIQFTIQNSQITSPTGLNNGKRFSTPLDNICPTCKKPKGDNCYIYGLFSTIADAHNAFQTSFPEIDYWKTDIFINFDKPVPAFLSATLDTPLLKQPPQG